MKSDTPLRWTILRDGALPGVANMARDAALARLVSVGVARADPPAAFLRFYAWARPTLSFGRNEPARARFDPGALAEAGVDAVRRSTGGRVVLHDREVTYAVVVPARALGGPRETYRRIHAALARGLAAMGAEIALAEDAPAARPDAGPCFDLPAGGEVTARGRKLVGSAQARIGGALLQHGSILLADDQGRIAELARGSVPPAGAVPGDAPARAISLAEILGSPPGFTEVVDALLRAFRAELPGEWTEAVAARCAFEAEASEGASAFDDPAWTWRR
ncbi:MAG: hypothetical protein RQ745_02225 [Longimicrobiales bacterium]|nr:hypothetical protein [Longimicrobiales bacterium]